MDRMLQSDAPEEAVPQAGGGSALRSTVYTVLAVMLLAGAWVRFNGQIASAMPALAGPAAQIADELGFSSRMPALLELGLLPEIAPKQAVAAMGLGAGEAALMSDALLRRRLHLVRLPVIDVSPMPAAGDISHSVLISAGGYTRLVQLSRQPVVLTLPIGVAGTVTFRGTDGDTVSVAALTLAGPVRLPALQQGQSVSVGVVAQ